MVRLGDQDVRRLVSGVGSLHEQRDLEGLAWQTVRTLEGMVACDWASVSLAAPASRRGQATCFWSSRNALQESLLEQFRAFYDEHPMWARFWGSLDPAPSELALLAPSAYLDRLAIQHEVFAPLGIGNMIGVCCPESSHFAIGVIRRRRREFSARDRVVVEVLSAQLAGAARRLAEEEMDAHEERIERIGYVGLDAGGRAIGATPGASQCLAGVVSDARMINGLPREVAQWVAGGARRPFMMNRGRCVGRATALPGRGRFARLLCLERWRRGALVVREEIAARLSDREREVAHWVVEGKTNPEIAIILGISPRTVQKHLEHAFRKLGVPTRTALAAALVGA